MANHLTPSELAEEAGLERRQVLAKCVEMGVPVFHGQIDKSLFLSSLHEEEQFEDAQCEGPPGASLMQHAA